MVPPTTQVSPPPHTDEEVRAAKRKPSIRKIVTSGIAEVLAATLTMGALLDMISNSRQLINPLLTYTGTFALLLLWGWSEYRHRTIDVAGSDPDEEPTIPTKRRIGRQRALYVACLVVLWIPRGIDLIAPNTSKRDSTSIDESDQLPIDTEAIQSTGGGEGPALAGETNRHANENAGIERPSIDTKGSIVGADMDSKDPTKAKALEPVRFTEPPSARASQHPLEGSSSPNGGIGVDNGRGSSSTCNPEIAATEELLLELFRSPEPDLINWLNNNVRMDFAKDVSCRYATPRDCVAQVVAQGQAEKIFNKTFFDHLRRDRKNWEDRISSIEVGWTGC